jgi:hypothetical protein
MSTRIWSAMALFLVAVFTVSLRAGGDSLTVDGVEYTNWSLVKEYPQSVFIQHEGGRTFINKSKLAAADLELMGIEAGATAPATNSTAPSTDEPESEEPPAANSPLVAEGPTKKVYSKDELSNAYYSARNALKQVLTAPSTAKFSNPVTDPNTGATQDDAGRIICRGTVESQNAFGVPLKQSWVVWLIGEGDKWLTVYAVLDGQVLLDNRDKQKTQQTRTAESFLGMSREQMLKEVGQPVAVTDGGHPDDGTFKLYNYGGEKGAETFFTIWDSDGKISSGMYQGTSFSE